MKADFNSNLQMPKVTNKHIHALQGNETLFVLCRFYLFLKYRRINVQKDKEFHQELYNIYTTFFSFFMEN